MEARLDQILARLTNLEKAKVVDRVENEIHANNLEGEISSHGKGENQNHDKEKSSTPSIERKKKIISTELSRDMKKIIPPKFDGSVGGDEAEV